MCWEKFEDTKGVIKIRQSKNDRQHNAKKKPHTENYRSSNTNPTKNWDVLRWSGMVSISCSTSVICHFILVTNMVIGHAWRKVYHRWQLQEKNMMLFMKTKCGPSHSSIFQEWYITFQFLICRRISKDSQSWLRGHLYIANHFL